jgi:hypothetical protein
MVLIEIDHEICELRVTRVAEDAIQEAVSAWAVGVDVPAARDRVEIALDAAILRDLALARSLDFTEIATGGIGAFYRLGGTLVDLTGVVEVGAAGSYET